MTSPAVFTAPYRLNLGPASPILDSNGKPRDLSVSCGADWMLTAPLVASDNVTPLPLANSQMQIRQGSDTTSTLLITPVLTVSGNTVTISIPGALSLPVTSRSGAYDLWAIRTDTGQRLKLLEGTVTFVPPTTILI